MYQVGDKVLYGAHGVCCIVGLEKRTIDRRSVPYYALEPIEQPGTRYYVPKENPLAVRALLSVKLYSQRQWWVIRRH